MNNSLQIDLSKLVVGDWFYTSENNQIEVYQLLENHPAYLVKAHWPIVSISTLETIDIRTNCTHFSGTNKTLYFLKTSELNTIDLQEISQYKRIIEGKKAREEHFQSLVQAANKFIAEEAAPFAKLDISIYQKRGFCAFHLGKYHEAIADFEYVLSQTNDQECLQLCITAYEHVGNVEKANEKRNLIKV